MRPFEIDPDIAAAHTPPRELYADPAWLERQRERVFARAWHWAADTRTIGPREQRPLTLLAGFLDEPLALVRDRAGTLRALGNVCTHRGNLLVTEPQHGDVIRCGYHGRCFELDGRFKSMPGFEGVRGFPGPHDDLAGAQLGTLGPFGFTAVDPALPFDAWIEPLRARLGWLDLAALRLDPDSQRDYFVDAHWALYLENFLEGFHVPFVHRALATVLDWQNYRTELFAHGSMQVGVGAPGQRGLPFATGPGAPAIAEPVAALWFWLWPGTLVNVYPWGLSINLVEPLGVARTRIRFFSYVADESLRAEGAGQDLHRVELEDEAVVQQVQRGMRSRLYRGGRYSPSQERGVHHFHRLLAAALR